MNIKTLILGAAFSGAMAIGALSAAPAQALPLSGETGYAASAESPVVDVRYKGRHWRGHRGRHYGWDRGRHRGWYKHHHRRHWGHRRHWM